MTPAERKAVWEVKVLLAAVENVLHMVETGRLDEAERALIRVEGMATTAKGWVRVAMDEEVMSGNRVG